MGRGAVFLLAATVTQRDLTALLSESRPTPEVSWTKVSGELPSKRTSFLHFQKTLRIVNVSDSDAGDYRCTAKNRLGAIHHTIRVSVKGTSTVVKVHKIKVSLTAPMVNLYWHETVESRKRFNSILHVVFFLFTG